MKKKIFEFIKKADFVLVFVFALLGIIALGSALINDLLPFHLQVVSGKCFYL